MDKYKRYYGLAIFVISALLLVYASFNVISPKLEDLAMKESQVTEKEGKLEKLKLDKARIESRKKQIQTSNVSAQKKIYSPVESDLENDSLFFALYNDVIEMFHVNSIKIRAIDYKYNPADDAFVKSGKDYFVCDVDAELVSNYTNLGKLIQELYQYPYYIKINKLDVKPYAKDKKVLLSSLSLRLYARTEPEENLDTDVAGNSVQPNI